MVLLKALSLEVIACAERIRGWFASALQAAPSALRGGEAVCACVVGMIRFFGMRCFQWA